MITKPRRKDKFVEDKYEESTAEKDNVEASDDDIFEGAVQWVSHFGRDSFNNHYTNNDHNCT